MNLTKKKNVLDTQGFSLSFEKTHFSEISESELNNLSEEFVIRLDKEFSLQDSFDDLLFRVKRRGVILGDDDEQIRINTVNDLDLIKRYVRSK